MNISNKGNENKDFNINIGVIITAGGISSRFGSNKLIENIEIEGKKTSVILATIEKFIPFASKIVIPAQDDIIKHLKNIARKEVLDKIQFAPPGKTRQESVFHGLLEFEKRLNQPDIVLIHDGARPFINPDTILTSIETLKSAPAICVGVYSTDTIKITDGKGKILKTIDRNTVFQAQTPQGFDFKTILGAHKKLKGENFTDDSSMVESLGIEVLAIEGNRLNKKITFREDLA